MEIISRKSAIERGLPQYFTGKPCKHGHATYRYTQSGSCSMCVNGRDNHEKLSFSSTMQQARELKRLAFEETAIVKVRCRHADAPKVRDVAAAMTLARYPALTRADVVIVAASTGNADVTGLYRVRCNPDDIKLIRDIAEALRIASSPPVDFSQVHARLYAAQAALDAEGAPPAWTEKP